MTNRRVDATRAGARGEAAAGGRRARRARGDGPRAEARVRARRGRAGGGWRARAGARAALHALDGATRTRSPRKRAARVGGPRRGRAEPGRPARGGPRTRDLRVARFRGGADRCAARAPERDQAQRAERARRRRVRRLREPLAGALEAAAAEDATGAFATRSVDTADRSAHDADASVDPMSVALREADVAPPGACLAEAFGVLRGFVVADRGVPGEADADLESDRAVREGLLPAIVRAALASIADLNGRLNRDGNARREASSAGPRSEEIYGEARREREALVRLRGGRVRGFGKKASRATRDGEAASAFAGVGPAPPGGGGGGEGGFVRGHGQSLRGQRGGGRRVRRRVRGGSPARAPRP